MLLLSGWTRLANLLDDALVSKREDILRDINYKADLLAVEVRLCLLTIKGIYDFSLNVAHLVVFMYKTCQTYFIF